jgi:hypothetical protein
VASYVDPGSADDYAPDAGEVGRRLLLARAGALLAAAVIAAGLTAGAVGAGTHASETPTSSSPS